MSARTAAPAAAGREVDDDRTPRWRPIACMAICVVGIGISIYLTYVHYSPGALSCPAAGSVIDCQAVLQSAESVLFGIPVPFYGMAFFVAMFLLSLPVAWRSPLKWVAWARVGAVVVGMCMVLYLISQELITIRKICLWCTSVHVLTFALFLLVLTGWEQTGWARTAWTDEPDED